MFPEFSAVLLAGGRSSRMGRDKALLPHPLSGLPMVVHQVNTLRAAGCAELFLSVREGTDYSLISSDVRRIRDDGEGGPLPVIEQALGVAGRPVVLMLAVDMPFVTSELARALVARSLPNRGVVARHAGGFEPLCAVYAKVTRPLFTLARCDKAYGLQPLLAHGVRDGWMLAVDDFDPVAFANWNRPEDLPDSQTVRPS